MYTKEYARIFERKLFVSLLIILIYIAGCNIPMPWIVRTVEKTAQAESMSTFQAQGLDLSVLHGATRLPLLMLGFSPWLRAKIIVQIVTLLFRIKNISASTINLLSDLLAILFGSYMIITLLGSGYYTSTENMPPIVWKTFAYICLITGMLVIIWLAKYNSYKGLGGTSFLILVNIFRNQEIRLRNSNLTLTGALSFVREYKKMTAICAIYILILIVVMVTMQRTQIRLKIHRSLIQSLSEQNSYFAVQLNPSGGMSVMFASVVYELLYLLSRGLFKYFPGIRIIRYIAEYGTLDHPAGISVYLASVFAMTIIFPRIMIDSEKIADEWRKSGDYIIGVRPGKDTEHILRRTVTRCSIASGLVLMVFLAIPMICGLYFEEIKGLHALVITLIIVIGLMLTLFEEARMMLKFKDYTTLL